MKKQNNQGFTIIELLTSFTLASVVMILLFNILITIKENYIHSTLETEFETQFSLFANALNEESFKCNVTTANATNTSTLSKVVINFIDSPTCDVKSAELTKQTSGNKVVFNYIKTAKDNTKTTLKYEFPEGVKVVNNLSLDRTAPYYFMNIHFEVNYPMSGETKSHYLKVLYNK